MDLEKLHFKEGERNALKLVHVSNNRFLRLRVTDSLVGLSQSSNFGLIHSIFTLNIFRVLNHLVKLGNFFPNLYKMN